MNELERALYQKLSSDATLGALLSGTAAVYNDRAPQGANMPYVVFSQQADTPVHSLAEKSFDNLLYTVKGVTSGGSPVTGGSIAARIEALLDDGTLAISGRTQMSTRKESGISYPEVAEGQLYRHRGGLYRIYVD